ncbi:MAG: hypothetical protein C4589_09125 [Peptococcaceae bacterium]|nr:MAG: hypothetical protein C4589_09125 [Peptococcaceae bacterium]
MLFRLAPFCRRSIPCRYYITEAGNRKDRLFLLFESYCMIQYIRVSESESGSCPVAARSLLDKIQPLEHMENGCRARSMLLWYTCC